MIEHGDTYYDFWFGWDEGNSVHYQLSIDDLEKMRERGQPLVDIN